MEINPNFDEANSFISKLSGQKDSKETFQVFHDSIKGGGSYILHGTLEANWKRLVSLNKDGNGIFITINKTDLKGRKTNNIVKVRALFTDDDLNLNINIGIKPSFKVRSKAGLHKYYLADDIQLNEFKQFQQSLAVVSQTDLKINDLPRVMRLPGFFHLKDIKNPFMVRIEND
jgi:hypothetical protein